MRFKILALLAAATLVAACSSAEEEAVATDTSGDQAVAAPPPPPPPPEPTVLEQLVQVGNSVFFVVDRSDLSAQAQATLDQQAALLSANPAITITIEGHADERGTDDYNLALSARRANSAKDYLIARGIGAARISTVPYGETQPIARGSNEAAWAQNRRAVTVITGGAGS